MRVNIYFAVGYKYLRVYLIRKLIFSLKAILNIRNFRSLILYCLLLSVAIQEFGNFFTKIDFDRQSCKVTGEQKLIFTWDLEQPICENTFNKIKQFKKKIEMHYRRHTPECVFLFCHFILYLFSMHKTLL